MPNGRRQLKGTVVTADPPSSSQIANLIVEFKGVRCFFGPKNRRQDQPVLSSLLNPIWVIHECSSVIFPLCAETLLRQLLRPSRFFLKQYQTSTNRSEQDYNNGERDGLSNKIERGRL